MAKRRKTGKQTNDALTVENYIKTVIKSTTMENEDVWAWVHVFTRLDSKCLWIPWKQGGMRKQLTCTLDTISSKPGFTSASITAVRVCAWRVSRTQCLCLFAFIDVLTSWYRCCRTISLTADHPWTNQSVTFIATEIYCVAIFKVITRPVHLSILWSLREFASDCKKIKVMMKSSEMRLFEMWHTVSLGMWKQMKFNVVLRDYLKSLPFFCKCIAFHLDSTHLPMPSIRKSLPFFSVGQHSSVFA